MNYAKSRVWKKFMSYRSDYAQGNDTSSGTDTFNGFLKESALALDVESEQGAATP